MRTVFSIITALVSHIYVIDHSSLLDLESLSANKKYCAGSFGKIFTLFSPDLWKYALELRIAKDTILYCDTCFTAQVSTKY